MNDELSVNRRRPGSWAAGALWYGLGLWVGLEYVVRLLVPGWVASKPGLPGVPAKFQGILGLAVLLLVFVVLHRGWRSLRSMPAWNTPGSPPAVPPTAFPAFPTPQVGVVVLGQAVLLLAGVATLLPTNQPAEWQQATLMAFAAGLGAIIATILGYLRHASEDQDFDLAFAPWYVARPLIGVLLGLLFFFVVKGGILVVLPQLEAAEKDLNTYGLAAIGGMVGLFSKNAVEKLRELFNVLFQTKNGVHQELLDGLPPPLQEQVRPYLQVPPKSKRGEDPESAVDRMDV